MIYIVHVIESFSGGSLDVVRALTKINKIGEISVLHKVIYGHRSDSPENPRIGFDNQVELISWPHATREISPIQDFYAFMSLKRILSQQPTYKIVHLHSSKAGFLGRLVCMLPHYNFRSIYTPHGVAMLRQDISAKKRQLYAVLERLAAANGGKVVACSSLEQKAFLQIGVNADIVANGVPDKQQVANIETLQRIVVVGRLTEAKDPIFLANLAKRVYEEGLAVEFVWIGDGELSYQLHDAPVKLTGWLTQDQVIIQLLQAQLFISTSLWEGLSLAALQAMGAGIPLLLRRGTGNDDLLRDSGGALGFTTIDEAVDQIKRLLTNPKALQKMAQQARTAFVNHYTDMAMCKKYTEVYATIITAHS